MSNKKQQIPAIRFNGFTDAWEQRELGDVFLQTSKYVNPKESNLELWSLTVENGLTPKTARYNREFLVKKEDQFKAVDHNEFIYNPMNMTLGALDLNLTGQTVAVSGYYITMLSKDGFDSKYFSIWLKSPIAIKMYKLYATGSLIERQRVQFPTLSQIKANVPQIGEQTKIGSFFNQLDNTIALHQRQLENYSQLKNAMIQKIFNKELRFKNENGNDYSDWEKKRLGEILAEVVRKSTKQDQHVILSSTNKGLFLQSEYFISNIASADNIGYKIMRKSEIVFSPQNLWMGNINYNDKYEIGLVSPSYKIFAISEEVIPKFMKYMIKTPYLMNEYLLSSEQGASVVRRNLDMDLFNKILVEIPSLPEQHQIASFLVALDCNIDQLTRKIELVKDKKKGLLQLMFI